MAETEEDIEAKPRKKSKMPLIVGLVLAIALGGGGFFAARSGLLFGSEDGHSTTAQATVLPLPDIKYVKMDPLVINLGAEGSARHLRFQAQVEVNSEYASDVESVLPRIVDVLNSYLRAIDIRDIEDRASMVRLRAQMLRRIQMVTGADRVRDLLIMEFVLN